MQKQNFLFIRNEICKWYSNITDASIRPIFRRKNSIKNDSIR